MYIHYPEQHPGAVITHYERLEPIKEGSIIVPTYLGFIGVATEIKSRPAPSAGNLIIPGSTPDSEAPPGWIRLNSELDRLNAVAHATPHPNLELMIASSVGAWEHLLVSDKPTAVHLCPEEIYRTEDVAQTLPSGLIVAPEGYTPDNPTTLKIFEGYTATEYEMSALQHIEAAVRGLMPRPVEDEPRTGQYL